jgi:transposase
MGHIEGASRAQHMLFPEVLDAYIAEEHPARVIDAFVESLDLDALGFRRTRPAATGRPSYDPGDLLKRYIYGYMHRLRSSRRLERETPRHVELLWLLRKLQPDFNTMADFRKDNVTAFTQVFRAFVLLCKEWGLFGQELVAIDGSKFKAVNNRRSNFTKAKLRETLTAIDAKIEHYMRELDKNDVEEANVQQPTVEALQEKVRQLRERNGRYEGLLQEMDSTGQSQVSVTDPDSRALPKRPKVDVGDNAQVAVDDKHHLFVGQDVTNAVTDVDQLSNIAIQATEALEVEQLTVVAARGDSHGEAINACEEAGIDPYGAKPLTSAHRKLGLFGTERFTDAPAQDCYRCPAGQMLTFRFATVELGRPLRYDATTACRAWAIKARCPRNQEGRRMTRWVHEHILERMQKRVEATPAIMKRRPQIVAPPFGTIKHWHDQGDFLMKGLEKVRAECSRSTLAYNLSRVMTLLGVPHMLQALA